MDWSRSTINIGIRIIVRFHAQKSFDVNWLDLQHLGPGEHSIPIILSRAMEEAHELYHYWLVRVANWIQPTIFIVRHGGGESLLLCYCFASLIL